MNRAMIFRSVLAAGGFNMKKLCRQIIFSLGIVLCLVLLIACADKDNPLVWTEDIVMPDQRVVTLRRVQHFDEGDYVGAHSFEFAHPLTKQTIKWQSDPLVNFGLVSIFFIADAPHILARPRFGIDNQNAGCPHPSMFIFRWDGAQWQQIPYKDSPLPEIRNNVTVDPKFHRENIKNLNYRIAAGGVTPLTHPEDSFMAGITLQKFPTQVFQCLAYRKVEFK